MCDCPYRKTSGDALISYGIFTLFPNTRTCTQDWYWGCLVEGITQTVAKECRHFLGLHQCNNCICISYWINILDMIYLPFQSPYAITDSWLAADCCCSPCNHTYFFPKVWGAMTFDMPLTKHYKLLIQVCQYNLQQLRNIILYKYIFIPNSVWSYLLK